MYIKLFVGKNVLNIYIVDKNAKVQIHWYQNFTQRKNYA